MSVAIVVGVLVSVAVSTGSPSQTKPDFSGAWILITSETPQTLKLKQDAVSLTAEDSEHSVRYRLEVSKPGRAPTPRLKSCLRHPGMATGSQS